jgi:hypothetical protein
MQKNSLFDDYYLVGGTALSLQIGHRVSEDIDLFTKNKIDKEAILNFSKKHLSNDYKIINNSETIFQLFSENKKLKLDFVQFPYDLIDPLINEEGIRMIDKNDISAMKISAAGTRGNEAKDFVDIYYLLQFMPFDKMMENFKKKYQTNDVLHYLRSIIFFNDIKKENWQSVKLINNNFSSKEITERLTKEVMIYEKKIINSAIGKK